MAAGVLGGCSSSAQGGTASTADTSSAASTTASSADSGNVIRVGVVCSMTGGSAIYGEGAQNAVDMAVEEINSGDSGYTVEIVNGGKVADDAKDAKQAMNAYNKVMADSPAAIVGSFFSSVTLPMATQAANDGMLLLATGATNVDVTQKGSTIFRNCFIDPYQGKMAALFVKSKGFSKVAVIYAKDDDYSNGLKDAFVENCEANGIEITYTGECMSTDTDFSSQAAQAVASGAEFLYYPCFLDTVPLFVGAARNAGFTGTIMGGDAWDGADTTGLEEKFDDCYFTNHYSSEDTAPAVQNFVQKYTEKYVGDYRKDLEPMYRKDEQDKENAGEIGAWYSYYKGIESHVQLYTGHLLVYRIDYNEYTGGAHGIYMSTFLNLDLRTLAPIRLDDLFAGDYKEQLTDLLWNQLMADNKVATRQELEDMGYVTTGDLTPTENFYLGKDGITFYYNVYDIAPYVMGPVKITLPYEMMQHLLSDETMALNDVRNP